MKKIEVGNTKKAAESKKYSPKRISGFLKLPPIRKGRGPLNLSLLCPGRVVQELKCGGSA